MKLICTQHVLRRTVKRQLPWEWVERVQAEAAELNALFDLSLAWNLHRHVHR